MSVEYGYGYIYIYIYNNGYVDMCTHAVLHAYIDVYMDAIPGYMYSISIWCHMGMDMDTWMYASKECCMDIYIYIYMCVCCVCLDGCMDILGIRYLYITTLTYRLGHRCMYLYYFVNGCMAGSGYVIICISIVDFVYTSKCISGHMHLCHIRWICRWIDGQVMFWHSFGNHQLN